MSRLTEVNSQEFSVVVAQSGAPVVVDFYATWCPPCRMLAPLLDEMAARYGGRVRFVKVNIDESPDLARQYRVSGVPTLVFLYGGTEVDRVVGVPAASTLQQKISGLSKLAPAVG